MSHFVVMVIGDDYEQQLAPFHEFECTGVDDEFVQDIDVTDNERLDYENHRLERYKDLECILHNPYDDRFYREPTPEEEKVIGLGMGFSDNVSWTSKDWGDGRGCRAKIHFLPDGWKKVDVAAKDIMSFNEYLSKYHEITLVPYGEVPDLKKTCKYGYARLNKAGEVEQVITRTNPNKKWDWWVVGGRWTGWLKLKPGAKGMTGKPGLMTERAPPGYADQARKGDVDWDQMRLDEGIKARARWKLVREITGGQVWDSWDDICGRYENDIKRAREEYWDQPAIVLLKAADKKVLGWDINDDLTLDEEKYVEKAEKAAVCTFAYLKDGNWVERGQMGMWATVLDDQSDAQWNTHFNQMLDNLPDDVLITIVDCHI